MRRVIVLVLIAFLVIGFAVFELVSLRDSYIKHSDTLHTSVITGAERFFSEEDSISFEKTKEFIELAREQELGLVVIETLIVLIIFLLIVLFSALFYYELKLSELTGKSGK